MAEGRILTDQAPRSFSVKLRESNPLTPDDVGATRVRCRPSGASLVVMEDVRALAEMIYAHRWDDQSRACVCGWEPTSAEVEPERAYAMHLAHYLHGR